MVRTWAAPCRGEVVARGDQVPAGRDGDDPTPRPDVGRPDRVVTPLSSVVDDRSVAVENRSVDFDDPSPDVGGLFAPAIDQNCVLARNHNEVPASRAVVDDDPLTAPSPAHVAARRTEIVGHADIITSNSRLIVFDP